RVDGEILCLRCEPQGVEFGDPAPRRHRHDLGARPPPLHEAGQGERGRLRRRDLAPRAHRAPHGGMMTLRLVPPSLAGLPQYAAALEAGWSPSTTHDVSGSQLAALRADATAFLTELTRQDGTIQTASGAIVPRLPGAVFWLDDGEFCG